MKGSDLKWFCAKCENKVTRLDEIVEMLQSLIATTHSIERTLNEKADKAESSETRK